MTTYKIQQIMPVTIPMQACFYDDEEMEIVRQDVMCLAVIKFGDEDDFITTMVCDQYGNFYDPCSDDNFLGIEVNGDKINWDSEIRKIEKEIESRNGGYKGRIN
jgi:hypothetical protein